MLSRLEAVNQMLGTIRESPVSSLEGSLPSEALEALNVLDEVSAAVQKIGFSFNVEKNVTLTPDEDGLITLASDVIRFEPDRAYVNANHDPVGRGRRVYNRGTNSYTFTSPVRCSKLYRLLEWDYLPETARQYIAMRAARIFSNRVLGSEKTERDAGIEEQRAFRELRREHGQAERPNMLNSPGISTVAYRTSSWV